MPEQISALPHLLAGLLGDYPAVMAWYTAVARFLFPVLALLILARSIRSLLRVPHTPEIWGYLTLPNGLSEPLTHWENILGRAGASDVVLSYPTVSRQHAALIRAEDDGWTVYDLDSKGGVAVNGRRVAGEAPVSYGDVISLGAWRPSFCPSLPARRPDRPPAAGRRSAPSPPGWGSSSSPCSRCSPPSSSWPPPGRIPPPPSPPPSSAS